MPESLEEPKFEIIQKYEIVKEDWNVMNTLQLNASRVGSLDLGLYQRTRSIKDIYNDAEKGKIKLLISFGLSSPSPSIKIRLSNFLF